jgi:hypothetical protein
MTTTKNATRFNAESARNAQPLAVRARAATDRKIRESLVETLPELSLASRRAIAARLPVRMIVDLLWAKR